MSKRAFNREIFARLWSDHSIPTRRIADTMGITRSGASWHARHMGLPSRRHVRRTLRRDVALFTEMWIAGVSTWEMAAHFGYADKACVSRAARDLGLPRREKGKAGRRNGGWAGNMPLVEFAEMQLAKRMAKDVANALHKQEAVA